MAPSLEENKIPHHTQFAYQAGLSCADPTEVVQEVLRSHIQHGFTVYQCFYDLGNAFDSVEYCALLDHLYRSGINGKCWILLYQSFWVGGQVSKPFTLYRGVRQSSVLSPMLFLLVMDSILTELQSADTGLSINGIYAGSIGHADDLRSVTPRLVGVQKQADVMKSFTEWNGLILNTEKLELLAISDGNSPSDCTAEICSISVTSSSTARCLGVMWTYS